MKSQTYVMGIDEAGRGPVLGPMVYGSMLWQENFDFDSHLKSVNVNDSKQVKESDRDKCFELFQKLKEQKKLDFQFINLSPQFLSNEMLKEKSVSLNEISKNAACEMIQYFLDQGYNLKKVFIDTVGPPESYRKELDQKFLGRNIQFTVEKKADSLFKIVSAASIVAKVKRDYFLKNWKFEENIKSDIVFGCGYPGDSLTVEWLNRNFDKNFGFPSVVRFSWKTSSNKLQELGLKYYHYDSMIQIDIDEIHEMNLPVKRRKPIEISEDELYKDLYQILKKSENFSLF